MSRFAALTRPEPPFARRLPDAGASARTRPAFGNQALLRRLQPKLTVGAVDDPLEREADRVADQVMRMPEPGPGPTVSASAPRVSRKCAGCDEEDKKTVRMKPAEGDVAARTGAGAGGRRPALAGTPA